MYTELNKNELNNVEGGALAGALAGAILGGCVGLVGATVKGCVTGNLTGNEIWKASTASALTGATIGAYTPV